MIIYNATDNAYLDLLTYLQEIENASGDSYRVVFLMNLDDLFTLAKKRTAIRGRFAKDQQGAPLVENFAMTDDERDLFDDWIKTAGGEVYHKVAAWAKTIDQAYRHNVKFGDPVKTGAADLVTNLVITDSSLALTPDALIGYKLVITSPGLLANQERTITDNDTTTITLDSAFDSDITGLEFAIFTQTYNYIMYYLSMNVNWDTNTLQGVENAIQEALVTYIIKEWYLANRYMDDYSIEEARYQKELGKITSQLVKSKVPIKRPTDFFI